MRFCFIRRWIREPKFRIRVYDARREDSARVERQRERGESDLWTDERPAEWKTAKSVHKSTSLATLGRNLGHEVKGLAEQDLRRSGTRKPFWYTIWLFSMRLLTFLARPRLTTATRPDYTCADILDRSRIVIVPRAFPIATVFSQWETVMHQWWRVECLEYRDYTEFLTFT